MKALTRGTPPGLVLVLSMLPVGRDPDNMISRILLHSKLLVRPVHRGARHLPHSIGKDCIEFPCA